MVLVIGTTVFHFSGFMNYVCLQNEEALMYEAIKARFIYFVENGRYTTGSSYQGLLTVACRCGTDALNRSATTAPYFSFVC